MDDLISRQAAMNIADDIRDCISVDGYWAWMERLKALPTAEPRWIPVSEKPKEEKKSYLVCTDDGYVCEARWTNANRFWSHLETDWHWNALDIPQYSKIIAWMPLPKPYEEESDE